MKDRITETDRTLLDLHVQTADDLHTLQTRLCNSLEVILDVEEWDEEKRKAIEHHIRGGAREDLESFLMSLGVNVELVPEVGD